MVTPNPENQLELEIAAATTDPVAPIEAPIEAPVEPAPADDFDEMADADTDDSPEPAPVETAPAPVLEPVAQAPAPAPLPAPSVPAADTVLQQQVRQQQEQLKQFQWQQYQQEVTKAVEDYTKQLENEGYMPEQATRMAAEARQVAERDMQTRQQHEQQLNFEQGRHNAARHYARHYKLTIDDMEQLEHLPDPQAMAREAHRIAEVRELKNQVGEMKRSQVPAQEFDSGRSSPGGGRSRQRLLDEYANGNIELTRDQYEKLMRSG